MVCWITNSCLYKQDKTFKYNNKHVQIHIHSSCNTYNQGREHKLHHKCIGKEKLLHAHICTHTSTITTTTMYSYVYMLNLTHTTTCTHWHTNTYIYTHIYKNSHRHICPYTHMYMQKLTLQYHIGTHKLHAYTCTNAHIDTKHIHTYNHRLVTMHPYVQPHTWYVQVCDPNG